MFGIAGVIQISGYHKEMEELVDAFISPMRRESSYIHRLASSEDLMFCMITSSISGNCQCLYKRFEDGISVGMFGIIFNEMETGETVGSYIHRLFVNEGTSCFAKLNGSFSIFIHDNTKDRFYIAVDRLASRQVLYYSSYAAFID